MALNIRISNVISIQPPHPVGHDVMIEADPAHPVTIISSNRVTFHADHQTLDQTAHHGKRFTLPPDLQLNMPSNLLRLNGHVKAAHIHHPVGIEALVPSGELLPQQLPLRK
jgi:hypothetical protein